MTRERIRPEKLDPFSEWHREHMPSWYTWIDIDYVGYVDSTQWGEYGYRPYIAIELIHVRNREKWGPSVNKKYPLHDHKQKFYEKFNDSIDIPVYVMWHHSNCDEFFIRHINASDTYRFTPTDFADFLDNQRKAVTEQKIQETKQDFVQKLHRGQK